MFEVKERSKMTFSNFQSSALPTELPSQRVGSAIQIGHPRFGKSENGASWSQSRMHSICPQLNRAIKVIPLEDPHDRFTRVEWDLLRVDARLGGFEGSKNNAVRSTPSMMRSVGMCFLARPNVRRWSREGHRGKVVVRKTTVRSCPPR
jgi:hypothetical protein